MEKGNLHKVGVLLHFRRRPRLREGAPIWYAERLRLCLLKVGRHGPDDTLPNAPPHVWRSSAPGVTCAAPMVPPLPTT